MSWIFLTDESSIGKGVRRIVGITGQDAIEICKASDDFYAEVQSFLNDDIYGKNRSEHSAEMLKEYRWAIKTLSYIILLYVL